ncbi:MAG: serine/threonine-protein kinase [Coleofasciculaceae cyanobacterium]
MSYCINPSCPQPNDPTNINHRICRNCGSDLLIQGRYQVMRLLSDKSGFGKVYEAYNGAAPKILKVLQQRHESNPKIIKLFQQEAAVLSQLNHPGIPKVEPDGYFRFSPRNLSKPLHCIVMEKIDGPNLRQWMKQQGNHPISETQALKWLKQLVEILHLVHQKQYFHRDIKPENIMLRPNGQLVLIDFGTARELTYTYLAEVGGAGSVTKISSTGYTPPEQENGHAVPQSDFYALGRTFVYLLTGKQPTEPPIYDPLTDQCNWQNYTSAISPQVKYFINHLMASAAASRPNNTQEILDKLAQIDKIPAQALSTTTIKDITEVQSSLPQPFLKSQNAQVKNYKNLLVVGVAALVVCLGGYSFWKIVNNYPNYFVTYNGIQLDTTIKKHTSYINYLTISPDGKSLVTASADKTIKIWELPGGKEVSTVIKDSLPINYFAIRPDWNTVATISYNNQIKIWDFTTGKEILIITGHDSPVNHLVISPDGKKLVSAGADKKIKIWDFSTYKEILTITGHESFVNYLIISPDGKKLVSADADGQIKIWDFSTGKEISTIIGHDNPVNYLVISPDGKKLVSAGADGQIKIWDFSTYKEILTITGHESSVKPLAISPDGKTLVSGSADGQIKIWDLKNLQEIESFTGHDSSVNTLAISPDGKILVSGSADNTIKIWQMPS